MGKGAPSPIFFFNLRTYNSDFTFFFGSGSTWTEVSCWCISNRPKVVSIPCTPCSLFPGSLPIKKIHGKFSLLSVVYSFFQPRTLCPTFLRASHIISTMNIHTIPWGVRRLSLRGGKFLPFLPCYPFSRRNHIRHQRLDLSGDVVTVRHSERCSDTMVGPQQRGLAQNGMVWLISNGVLVNLTISSQKKSTDVGHLTNCHGGTFLPWLISNYRCDGPGGRAGKDANNRSH